MGEVGKGEVRWWDVSLGERGENEKSISEKTHFEKFKERVKKEDINALKSELNDPRFHDEFWINEIKTQLEVKKKSEQQALAKYGLNYVTDVYLPEKLAEMGYEM